MINGSTKNFLYYCSSLLLIIITFIKLHTLAHPQMCMLASDRFTRVDGKGKAKIKYQFDKLNP